MGQRSRKKRRPQAATAPAEPPAAPRGEARNEEIRAGLEPLSPGERPTAVTVAAVVASVAAPANLLATGLSDAATPEDWRFAAVQSVVLAIAALGLWRARYWAVLGFQVLLGITIVIGAGAVLLAGNVAAVIFGAVTVLLAGTLFWKLVRAMARLQMPQRPRPRA